MATNTNDLPKAEIKQLVYAYEDPAITDELYGFGKMLLTEIDDRVKHIDSKAGSVLAWSTAILAFLFTQVTARHGAPNLLLGLVIGVLALLAVIAAYCALRTRQEWLWPSDRDWFEVTAFGSADELKRFHIRSMHEVRHTQRDITDIKGRALLRAEKFLVGAASLLAVGIAAHLLATIFPAWVVALDRGVRMCIGRL